MQLVTFLLALWHALTAPVHHADPVKPKPASRAHVRVAVAIPDVWRRLVACESPDRGWRYGAPDVGQDPGYDFEGGPNFTRGTWLSYRLSGYPAHAYDATPWQQITVARRVLHAQGPRAWPICSGQVGLTLQNGLG